MGGMRVGFSYGEDTILMGSYGVGVKLKPGVFL